ncbi:hypothetical protein [Brevibacterium album]|uniref:hypothetical protein n=1 Tax=Brevibacterium album TaxID=417948 RepID=UPI00048A65AE|nr:hypothetical protein [Brevibacterium album]
MRGSAPERQDDVSVDYIRTTPLCDAEDRTRSPQEAAHAADREYLPHARFPSAEAAREWDGFSPDEAHSWAGALFHVHPHPVSAEALRRAHDQWRASEVPQVLAWAQTAREARSAGFTPLTLKILRSALADLSPSEHPAHPHNLALVFPHQPQTLPFDVGLWRAWPDLVAGGVSPREAALQVLHEAEASAED